MSNVLPTFPYDEELKLVTAGTTLNSSSPGTTGALVGSVIDLGGADKTAQPNAAGDGAAAAYNLAAVVDVSAIKLSDEDELYELVIAGSNDPALAKANAPVVHLGSTKVGFATASYTAFAIAGTTGRILIPFTNYHLGDWHRYVRFFARVSGTSPSITLGAFIARVMPR